MSRRRQQLLTNKARRHLQPTPAVRAPVQWPPPPAQSRVVIREASYVKRLAYTRSQAAQALGISRSTLRRPLPYIETIELPGHQPDSRRRA